VFWRVRSEAGSHKTSTLPNFSATPSTTTKTQRNPAGFLLTDPEIDWNEGSGTSGNQLPSLIAWLCQQKEKKNKKTKQKTEKKWAIAHQLKKQKKEIKLEKQKTNLLKKASYSPNKNTKKVKINKQNTKKEIKTKKQKEKLTATYDCDSGIDSQHIYKAQSPRK